MQTCPPGLDAAPVDNDEPLSLMSPVYAHVLGRELGHFEAILEAWDGSRRVITFLRPENLIEAMQALNEARITYSMYQRGGWVWFRLERRPA